MTRLVRIDLVERLAGIVVDDDGGKGRMIIGAVKGMLLHAVPAALVGLMRGALAGVMCTLMRSMGGGAARMGAISINAGKRQGGQHTDARETIAGRDVTQIHGSAPVSGRGGLHATGIPNAIREPKSRLLPTPQAARFPATRLPHMGGTQSVERAIVSHQTRRRSNLLAFQHKSYPKSLQLFAIMINVPRAPRSAPGCRPAAADRAGRRTSAARRCRAPRSPRAI